MVWRFTISSILALMLLGAVAAAADTKPPIDLATAITLALEQSPELAAREWSQRKAEARIEQARLRPNPDLKLELEDFAGSGAYSGVDEADATIILGQVIELGGKRRARIETASAASDFAGMRREIHRLDVIAATKQAFVGVLAAQLRSSLADDGVALAEKLGAAVKQRVRAGSSSRIELTKVEALRASAAIERERARQALAVARRQLALQWGEEEASFERADGAFTEVTTAPNLADLTAKLVQSPRRKLWDLERVRRQAEVELAQSEAVPNVEVGLGYRRLAGPDENAMVAELRLPLPIFDRNQGAVREARHDLASIASARRGFEVRLATALATAHQALALAHDEAQALDASVLPAVGAAFDATHDGYREGRFSYLDVLDAEKRLVEARLQRVEAAAAYHVAAAEIERLLGAPMSAAGPATLGSAEPATKDAPQARRGESR